MAEDEWGLVLPSERSVAMSQAAPAPISRIPVDGVSRVGQKAAQQALEKAYVNDLVGQAQAWLVDRTLDRVEHAWTSGADHLVDGLDHMNELCRPNGRSPRLQAAVEQQVGVFAAAMANDLRETVQLGTSAMKATMNQSLRPDVQWPTVKARTGLSAKLFGE